MERLRASVEKINFINDIKKTASFGVVQLGEDCPDKEIFFGKADIGLYYAKAAGRNSIGFLETCESIPEIFKK